MDLPTCQGQQTLYYIEVSFLSPTFFRAPLLRSYRKLLSSSNNGYDVDLAFRIAEKSIEAYQPKHTLETVYLVLYGFAAMNVARKYGYSVEEFIDQKAVLHKEEELKHPFIKILEKGQDFANGVKDKGLEQAMAFLDNEENQNMVLEHGKNIAARMIKKGMNAAVNKVMKQG